MGKGGRKTIPSNNKEPIMSERVDRKLVLRITVWLHEACRVIKGVKKVRSAIKLCSYYFSYNVSL